MSYRNYNPKKCEEEVYTRYMNIPRTSLRMKDIVARSLRGAPVDAPDISSTFGDDVAENDWRIDAPQFMDHVDAYEHLQALKDKQARAVSEAQVAQAELNQQSNVEPVTAVEGKVD